MIKIPNLSLLYTNVDCIQRKNYGNMCHDGMCLWSLLITWVYTFK